MISPKVLCCGSSDLKPALKNIAFSHGLTPHAYLGAKNVGLLLWREPVGHDLCVVYIRPAAATHAYEEGGEEERV